MAQDRLTARSVVLSVLLGAHPASASAAELLRLTAEFGLKESALRVALTRMVAGGDLLRTDGAYRLSDRLLDRQRRQDEALTPQLKPWTGDWSVAVITSVGNDARSRTALRAGLTDARYGELREGVWLRPDNLRAAVADEIGAHVRILTARDDRPVELAARLWELSEWAAGGQALLAAMAAADDVPGRFTVAAAIVRQLRTDPVLPPELLPPDWPGEELRSAYRRFAGELDRRRPETT